MVYVESEWINCLQYHLDFEIHVSSLLLPEPFDQYEAEWTAGSDQVVW